MNGQSTGITLDEIKGYAATSFDFSFEMQVLNCLTMEKFSCEHGGSYQDPATGKYRQFDIRCRRDYPVKDREGQLRLAIECKNITAGNAIVAHTVKRRWDESFHQIVTSANFASIPGRSDSAIDRFMLPGASRQQGVVLNVPDNHSIYGSGAFVAKALNHVNKAKGSAQATDRDLYDSWSQAIASARTYIDDVLSDWDGKGPQVFIPFVVVPDERLFEIKYDNTGKQLNVEKVKSVSLLINVQHPIPNQDQRHDPSYNLSHLEICEISNLIPRIHSFIAEHNMPGTQPLFY